MTRLDRPRSILAQRSYLYARSVPVAPISRAALQDVRGVWRALYAARRAAGADHHELGRLSRLGEEITRLLRRLRFGADGHLWADTRLRIELLLGACAELPEDLRPGVLALLEAAAAPILAAPEQPGEGEARRHGTKAP